MMEPKIRKIHIKSGWDIGMLVAPFVVGGLGLFGFLFITTMILEQEQKADLLREQLSAEVPLQIPSAFEQVLINAHSVAVYDLSQDEIIYERQAYAPRPLASLAKIMTALVALEYGDEDQVIKLSKTALEQEGDTGLLVDEEWDRDRLVSYMLVTSSNDAAYALAESIEINGVTDPDNFVAVMNQYASEHGFATLRFQNASGLDLEGPSPSAFGSGYDMVRLIEHALEKHPRIFAQTAYDGFMFTSRNGEEHVALNTNVLTRSLPALVASKTGFTDASGGNLLVVFEAGPNRPVAISVMGSSFGGRFVDVDTAIRATLKDFSQQKLLTNFR